jgi:hypothetical protein
MWFCNAERRKIMKRSKLAIASAVTMSLLYVTSVATAADQAKSQSPLVIKEQGSFFVGGRTIFTTALTGDPTGGLFPPNEGSVTVDQMYVQYQVPMRDSGRAHLPVVMVHGGTLTGKSYETTPDGRMGWDEYFLRKHRPAYLVDQVARGRSGFDATVFNEVKMGLRPPSDQPSMLRISHETGWTWWRLGPTPGTPFPDTQFPLEGIDEFRKQAIPDLNAMLPAANPTYNNLAQLANQLGGAIIMGHSQSAFFPQRAAFVDPTNIKGMITLETGLCPASFPPEQIAIMAQIPMIILYGDHIGDGPPAFATLWTTSLNNCRNLAQTINDAGGDATFVHLPEIGIHGNTHFLMFDKNNLQIADLILDWIDSHVEGKK